VGILVEVLTRGTEGRYSVREVVQEVWGDVGAEFLALLHNPQLRPRMDREEIRQIQHVPVDHYPEIIVLVVRHYVFHGVEPRSSPYFPNDADWRTRSFPELEGQNFVGILVEVLTRGTEGRYSVREVVQEVWGDVGAEFLALLHNPQLRPRMDREEIRQIQHVPVDHYPEIIVLVVRHDVFHGIEQRFRIFRVCRIACKEEGDQQHRHHNHQEDTTEGKQEVP